MFGDIPDADAYTHPDLCVSGAGQGDDEEVPRAGTASGAREGAARHSAEDDRQEGTAGKWRYLLPAARTSS